MSEPASTEDVCRTCLKPNESLVDEGGLLFCPRCLKNYKFLMAWMKGENPDTADDDRAYFAPGMRFQERQKLFIKTANYDPPIMLGNGTWIPAKPPEATSAWIITPDGWKPPPSFDRLATALPAPPWRKVWSRVVCWWRNL